MCLMHAHVKLWELCIRQGMRLAWSNSSQGGVQAWLTVHNQGYPYRDVHSHLFEMTNPLNAAMVAKSCWTHSGCEMLRRSTPASHSFTWNLNEKSHLSQQAFHAAVCVLCLNTFWPFTDVFSATENSIAFGKSTSQRIYSKQRTHKIGENDINTA